MRNKSRTLALALILFLGAAAVFSLPHVAVLDTILAAGMVKKPGPQPTSNTF